MSAHDDGNDGKKTNQHIPKYIVNQPWYEKTGTSNEDDYLAHHRKQRGEIVDYSVAQTGPGITDRFDTQGAKVNEEYDAKRDRWYGYGLDQWESVLNNWDRTHKHKKSKPDHDEQESDSDTDYELELVELNLAPADIKKTIKENPLEKTVRDRKDIASYIHNITSNSDNKIKIDRDAESGVAKNLTKNFINDDDQFVRQSDNEGKKLQKFAWEINKQDELESKKKLIQSNFTNDEVEPSVNLDHNLEASPTLMMLKAKQHEQQREEMAKSKRKALLEMYGTNSNVKYDSNDISEFTPNAS